MGQSKLNLCRLAYRYALPRKRLQTLKASDLLDLRGPLDLLALPDLWVRQETDLPDLPDRPVPLVQPGHQEPAPQALQALRAQHLQYPAQRGQRGRLEQAGLPGQPEMRGLLGHLETDLLALPVMPVLPGQPEALVPQEHPARPGQQVLAQLDQQGQQVQSGLQVRVVH